MLNSLQKQIKQIVINLFSLHIEPTSRCNARCPQCPRTDITTGDTHSWLKQTEWDPSRLDEVLSHSVFDPLNSILVNGNYGDIVMHTRALEFVEVCRKHAKEVYINTNGSGLKTDFWSELGKMGVTVDFSIEGMSQETHEQYRRNTNFNRILENAKAFIDAGGIANWVMTVFRHNEDEVDDCEEFARYLGFNDFSTRDGGMRFDAPNLVFRHKGEEHMIEPPTDYYVALKDNPAMAVDLSLENKCYIRAKHLMISLFLSADQRIYPCCYADNTYNNPDDISFPLDLDILEEQVKRIYDEYVATQFTSNPKGVCAAVCGVKGTK